MNTASRTADAGMVADQEICRLKREAVHSAGERDAQVVVAGPSQVLDGRGEARSDDLNGHKAPADWVVAVDIPLELGGENVTSRMRGWKRPASTSADGLIVGVTRDWLPLDHVARPEQRHEFAQVADLLPRIVDRHWRNTEHLVTARAANRVDATETAAVTHGQLWCVGAGTQIFRRLELSGPLNHLVEKRQSRRQIRPSKRTRVRRNGRR